MNVYNAQNEKIGDIKELMLDKNGKINIVAIGVGGFLLAWVSATSQSNSIG